MIASNRMELVLPNKKNKIQRELGIILLRHVLAMQRKALLIPQGKRSLRKLYRMDLEVMTERFKKWFSK